MTPSETKKERRSAPGFTLMLIPQRGHGEVHQLTLSRKGITRILAGVGTIATVIGVVLAVGVTGPLGFGPVVEENLALKAQLLELESAVTEAEMTLERMQIHRTQLDALSGTGPLSAEEMSALGASEQRPRAVQSGELGEPMELARRSPEVDAGVLLSRTDRLLVALSLAEPSMARRVDAERIRRQTEPVIWPVRGLLSSGYGMRKSPVTRRYKLHSGIDIAAPRGTPVLATGAGTVVLSEYNSGYGNFIELDHGGGIVSRYAHCSRRMVEVGDEVLRGDLIATVGSTGQSTGPHLHYEILVDGEFIDPLDFIDD
jgi:murein DD-endopeptidase MepM/ murein hydrolase activator NlpD